MVPPLFMLTSTFYVHSSIIKCLVKGGREHTLPRKGGGERCRYTAKQKLAIFPYFGAIAKGIQEIFRPVVDAASAEHGYCVPPAVLALVKGHGESAGNGGARCLSVVGVDNQGAFELVRCAGELRQDEHPRVIWRL